MGKEYLFEAAGYGPQFIGALVKSTDRMHHIGPTKAGKIERRMKTPNDVIVTLEDPNERLEIGRKVWSRYAASLSAAQVKATSLHQSRHDAVKHALQTGEDWRSLEPPGLNDEQRNGTAWMVIGVDNYNRESVADIVLCRDCRNEALAHVIAAAMNDRSDNDRYYQAVPHNHKLSRGMEDVV